MTACRSHARWPSLATALLLLLPRATAAGPAPSASAALPLLFAAPVSPGDAAHLRRVVARHLPRSAPLSRVDRLRPRRPACSTSRCLVARARRLGARRLVGGRVERGTGGWTLTLWLFDAEEQTTVATHQDRCDHCSLAQAASWAGEVTEALLATARRGDATAQIDVRSTPPGAAVSIDGTEVGVSGMAFGVAPGEHTVTLRLAQHRLSVHQVQARPGRTVRLAARLQPAAPRPPDGDGHSWLRPGVLKWIGLGATVAGVAAGATLLALDGRGTCNVEFPGGQCQRLHDTFALGLSLTIVGGVAAGLTAYLFYDDATARSPALALTPVPLPGGGAMSAGLTF